jgi:hypothetical protein
LDLLPTGSVVQKQDCAALIENGSVFAFQIRDNGGERDGGFVRTDYVRHHFNRGERLFARPLQIQIELRVGIPWSEFFRDLEREDCFPDAPHAEQTDYPGAAKPDLFHEFGQLFRAAGKVGGGTWQLVK